jgi:hypothetical protein
MQARKGPTATQTEPNTDFFNTTNTGAKIQVSAFPQSQLNFIQYASLANLEDQISCMLFVPGYHVDLGMNSSVSR